jgi:hypothetical protein
VVKAEHKDAAKRAFGGTDIVIIMHSKHHLGAAVGSRDFAEEYIRNKVETWVSEVERLAKIAAQKWKINRVWTSDDSFWCKSQEAFFDVRVFCPNTSSYCNKDLTSLYRMHKRNKKREYGERICEVDCAFTPLVFTTTGGMARECAVFYKKLAGENTEKQKLQYPAVMNWLWCRLSFALLMSAI